MHVIGHSRYCIEAEFPTVPRKTCVDDDVMPDSGGGERSRLQKVVKNASNPADGGAVCGGIHICAAYKIKSTIDYRKLVHLLRVFAEVPESVCECNSSQAKRPI
jgi:hypothetical protein